MRSKKRIWDDILTERDRKIYEMTDFGRSTELGIRPALFIIDVTYQFVGDEPKPIFESMKEFPLSCGEAGWKAINNIQILLDIFRNKDIPIIFVAPELRRETANIGVTKRQRGKKDFSPAVPKMKSIVKEIEPRDGDVVIYKKTASAFFGTPLVSYLNIHSIDTLVTCGVATSGCVRASVVDAFSYGFKVAVVEDCTFDRGEVTHKINLFDMHQKYADVISLEDALTYLKKF